MYLCDEFFKNKPASMIRENLDWSELNDDCLARTLEKLFEVGVTEAFSHIVTRVTKLLESNLPIWMKTLDGNQSDVKNFPETIKCFCEQLNGADTPQIVMDAAFYSLENIMTHRKLS